MPLSMPLISAGCGQTACITWSPAEGTCPSQKEALPFFKGTDSDGCESSITAVESDGDYANNLCCYTVTKLDSSRVNDIPCSGPPFGGTGGSGVGGFGTTNVGTTGGGVSPPSCLRCSQAVTTISVVLGDNSMVCFDSAKTVDLMMDCLCNTTCKNSCGPNLCENRGATAECIRCLGDSEKGCGAVFDECLKDG